MFQNHNNKPKKAQNNNKIYLDRHEVYIVDIRVMRLASCKVIQNDSESFYPRTMMRKDG